MAFNGTFQCEHCLKETGDGFSGPDDIPQGWFALRIQQDGMVMDFCSLKCVGKFVKAAKAFEKTMNGLERART